MSTVFQQLLERGKEIGVKEGEEIVKEIGMREGEEKNSLRVALNCLKKGMDVQAIAEITGLPVERIELLKVLPEKKSLIIDNHWDNGSVK